MKNSRLPTAPAGRLSSGVQSYLAPRALERWNPGVQAAAGDGDNTITIYDVIGYDYWTGEGVTAKRISAALRSIGADEPVTVFVNSPGGDMFEGLAIYNLFREHRGDVTMKVIGLAASAASTIAMAGDNVQIARAGFFMVHNAWVVASGNRNDLRDYADTLEPFDRAMADIYAARTGDDTKAMQKLMDAETWIGGSDAIERGFADELLPADQVGQGEAKASATAVRRIEAALRQSGLPRSEAQRLISEFKSSLSDSAGSGEREPAERGLSESAAVEDEVEILAALKSFSLK